MNRPIQERAIYGIAGIGLLILGLYVGYLFLGFVSPAITVLSFWPPRSFDYLMGSFMFLSAGCIVLVLVFVIISNFLNIAYNSLTIAIKDTSPDRDWIIYKKQGATAITLLFIPLILASFVGMLYSFFYVKWDPHIGEGISKDDFYIKLNDIKATDQLEKYGYRCNNVTVGTGWKFIILDYFISARNKTRPISMIGGDITDENDIRYSNYYNDCLPRDEYYYRQEISDSKFGKLVYRIPVNAVPGKISLFINSTPTAISLHARQFL